MARRRHPDDEQLLHLADRLRELGCSPTALLHRAVIGESVTRPFADRKRPAKVSPKTIAEGGPWVLYSPTLLHKLFRLRLILTTSGGVPDYAESDLSGLPLRDEPSVKLRPSPTDEEIRRARYVLRAVGNALSGELRDGLNARFSQVMKAFSLHSEIRVEIARGTGSVATARARVAKRHRMTESALRRQIDRAKAHARDLNVRGAFPALSAKGRRPK